MKAYLSGPMTGLPELNFPAFFDEEARLEALGYEVVNPARINPDPATPWVICMKNDIRALLDCAFVVVLDGWENSNGALLELTISDVLGIPVVKAGFLTQPTKDKSE